MNPHCEHCRIEDEIKRQDEIDKLECKSCDTLRVQLDIANNQNKLLLEQIIKLSSPKEEIFKENESTEPVKPSMMTFSHRRNELEKLRRNEMNKKSEILKDMPESAKLPLSSIQLMEDTIKNA